MKARVKATGEIIEVEPITYRSNDDIFVEVFNDPNEDTLYVRCDLDFDIEGKFVKNYLNEIKQDIVYNPDYYTRLEHQYAGMAMQGYIIAQHIGQFSFCENDVELCKSMAHALVEKLKKEV